jgi:hypothetical protein
VAVGVPRDRRDGVALADLERRERLRQLLRSPARLAPGVAVNRSLDGARDDLDAAEDERGVLEERGDQERPVHHQPAHLTLRSGLPALS